MKPSKRQLELLQHCADGESVKSSAHIMKISKFTAMQYAVNVKTKLEARTMVHAVAIAIRRGYID